MRQNNWIKKIYVNRQVENSPLIERITDRLKAIPHQLVDCLEEVQAELRLAADPIAESKRVLFLTREKAFIRPCPCSPGAVPCGYWTVDLNLNCPLDCSYCILQAYFNLQPLTIAVNQEELKSELDAFLAGTRSKVLRIGTGELGDSLALEAISHQASFLTDLFRKKKGVWLELKTKTAAINSLLAVPASENVVLAWSLNTERIIKMEEIGSASLEERLRSAEKAVEHGFMVAFHFDPIVYYSGWEKEYSEVCESLLKKIPLAALAWVSLGTLRFPGKLREIARQRFPHSSIYEEEMVRGRDGKFRYPRPLRMRIYQTLAEIFKAHNSSDKLYLCMESPAVWEDFCRQNKKGKQFASPFFWHE
jgi:spore photoproduct lyase